MICQVCIGALYHRKGWVQSDSDASEPHVLLAHHRSIASLELSARDGCELCFPFWSQMDEDDQVALRGFDLQWQSRHAVKSKLPVAGEALENFDGLVIICAIINLGEEEGVHATGMDLLLSLTFESDFRDESPMARKNVSGTYFVQSGPGTDREKKTAFFSKDTASEEAWSKATTWIQGCASTHHACNVEAKAEPWYPTRLLDLAAPGLGLNTFRLVVISEHLPARNQRYTTLSHCWGTAEFLQLKKSTSSEFRKGIDLDRLPKTFREAIQVTRQLGVRYLWIDSLCIMQDRNDLSDWLVEAGLMHKVYSHSYCNISAAGARDSSKGLFFERNPRISETTAVELCVKGLGLGVDYLNCSIVDLGFWGHAVGQCPLNKRGWVLQERLLSPRVLHFGRDQLFWECREHAAAECYPDTLPGPVGKSADAKFKKLDPIADGEEMPTEGPEPDDPLFYYKVWNRIAQAYSDTLLTKSSDKLIALSGIAKQFATRVNDTYVVGMWRKYLASSLLWHVDGESQIDGSPSRRPEKYRAPSFSWASIDGRISLSAPTRSDLLIEVVDVHLDFVSGDETGLVKGGYLLLKAEVRPFRMVVRYTLELQQLFLQVNGAIVKDSGKQDWENGPLVHLDVGQRSFEDENNANGLYYIPTQTLSTPGGYVSYLLLASVGTSTSTFRRIGVAVTAEKEEIEMLGSPIGAAGGTAQRDSTMSGLQIIRII
ncbi:heterokaryon incompatibility protein [Colletotrichum musicola]|uniref:Heterokaryon incompatibility protein n=1 Tax=Colletotrichum musicola TaxID=2175873 RepID=A0A8H6KFX9_9PEZI|nr:heterokaryon incompatibility protein [Colletotrichum musicola]